MVCNAEQALAAYLNQHPEARSEWKANTKVRNDPRVTYFGRFLRRTHLDELPCIVNVLLGDISLVGPPPVPFNSPFVTTDTDLIGLYHSLKPGIFWVGDAGSQANWPPMHRRSIEFYLRDWSLLRDIHVIARSLPRLLLRRNH